MSAPTSTELPQPSNPAELETVLLQLTLPDTSTVQTATKILKKFLTQPASVQALMQQVVSSARPEARQMACVLLRTKIGKHWKSVPEEQQEIIKATLLKRLVEEPHRAARRGVAALISSVAKRTVPTKKWPQLLPFLFQNSKSTEANQRELSLLLFHALAENIGKLFKPHFNNLLEMFVAGLGDGNESVRLASLRALNALVEFIETEKEATAFRNVIPPLVTVVQKSAKEGSDEPVSEAFEILDNLAALPVDVLMHHATALIQMMLQVSVQTDLDVSVREKASALLSAMIAHKPGKIAKANLGGNILKCALTLIVEEFDETFDSEEMTPQKMGVEVLDASIANFPRRLTFENIMGAASTFLKSTSPHQRKGGFVVLAVVSEGFCELLKENLEQYLQAMCAGVKDSNPLVRAAAFVALTQFSDYLQPEITKFHKLVIPHLLLALDNSEETVTVKKKACVALDVFCEQLGDKVLPYMDELMKRFIALTSHKDTSLVVQAISGIKAIACAAGPNFNKYLKPISTMMKTLMEQTDDERLTLRSAATECIGEVANAVGKEAFKPYLATFLGLAVRGMELELHELREKTYSFFANLAQMLEADFEPLLETVMPLCVASCVSQDGLTLQVDQNELEAEAELEGLEEEGDDDAKDEELGIKRLKYKIRSGALDEKVAAVQCIHQVVESVGKSVVPYLPRTIDSLNELVEYPHHLARAAVCRCFAEILGRLYKEFPMKDKWSAGVARPIPKECKAAIKKIYPLMLQRMVEEEDKETCACACDVFSESMKLYGLGAVEPYLKELCEALTLLLKEKAPCQNAPDEDDNIQSDHDEVLIDAVTDVLSALAEICGPKFDPMFKAFVPLLLKFNTTQRAYSDRAMAIGCIAECSEHMGASLVSYLDNLFPVIFKGLADSHAAVRRNSAFCCGVLCKVGGEAASKYFPHALKALKPLFDLEIKGEKDKDGFDTKEEKEHRIPGRDNACSAVAKIISAKPEAITSLPDAVKLFLSGLPLQSDFEEAKWCYPLIGNLFKAYPKVIGPFLPQVINICSQVLGTDESKISKEIQDQLVVLCRALAAQQGPQIKTILAALPTGQRENFLKHIGTTPSTPPTSPPKET